MAEAGAATYENAFGKTRPITPESVQESAKRREYFTEVSEEVIKRLGEQGFTGIGFELTGSVSKNAAIAGSDIDVTIRYPKDRTGDPAIDGAIRTALSAFLTEKYQKQSPPFRIDLHNNPAEKVLNPVALFKLAQRAAKP